MAFILFLALMLNIGLVRWLMHITLSGIKHTTVGGHIAALRDKLTAIGIPQVFANATTRQCWHVISATHWWVHASVRTSRWSRSQRRGSGRRGGSGRRYWSRLCDVGEEMCLACVDQWGLCYQQLLK